MATHRKKSGWPEPFLRAKEFLEPIALAGGFRFVLTEQEEDGRNAFAEYRRPNELLRLVWEGTDGVLWLEAARERDAQLIGRWTDIEWILAGRRLPLNPDAGDERIAELVSALAEYLDRGARAPLVSTLTQAEPDGND